MKAGYISRQGKTFWRVSMEKNLFKYGLFFAGGVFGFLLIGCFTSASEKSVGDFAPIARGNRWEYGIIRSFNSEITTSARTWENDTGFYSVEIDSISSNGSVSLHVKERIIKTFWFPVAFTHGSDTLIRDTSFQTLNSIDSLDSALIRLEYASSFKNESGTMSSNGGVAYRFGKGFINAELFAPHAINEDQLSTEPYNGNVTRVFRKSIPDRDPPAHGQVAIPVGTATYVVNFGLTGYSYKLTEASLTRSETDSLVAYTKGN